MLGFGLGLNKWRRVGGGYVGLLDLYPNAAAAYSLRKLRAAYSGSAVRVRKEVSSVSSETDIGFLADGSLDTTSLLAFASDADSGDVFVVTWYDQSLSNDATQSTAAAQPKIVSGGSLETENGKAAIQFDESAGTYLDANSLAADFTPNGQISAFAVAQSSAASGQGSVWSLTDLASTSYYWGFHTSNWRFDVRDTASLSSAAIIGTISDQSLVYYNFNGSDEIEIIEDGTLSDVDSTTFSTITLDQFRIGAYKFLSTNNNFGGVLQELIFFNSDQSANRLGIETNINNFYSIYP